jgi:serine/threonine protein kinase
MAARHREIGKPVHERERRGIESLVSALPPGYDVYSSVELPTGQRGQTYEHDAVVVAPHAVFAVELKSWGGTISGNRDRFVLADGTVVPSPIPLQLAKARALKGQLAARRRELGGVWVQGLVYLTAGDAVAHISADFAAYVITGRTLRDALTRPENVPSGPVLTPVQRASIQAFLEDRHPGLAKSRTRTLGDFELDQRLAAEGRPYEAWRAVRRTFGQTRVLHVYPIDAHDAEERERQKALALREATLNERVRGGPDLFGYLTYHKTDDPPRIALEFEDATPLAPADLWVRDRNPGLVDRLVVLRRAAAALAHIHGRGLVHRRLGPDALLVDPSSSPPASVRLAALDLARDLTGAMSTLTGSNAFGLSPSEPAARCVAPEALRSGDVAPTADLFAFGATAFALLAGRPLFATTEAVLQPFTVPQIALQGRPVPDSVQRLVERLLAPAAAQRPQTADEVVKGLDACLAERTAVPIARGPKPGDVLRETYELVAQLGRGATAVTWKARHLQSGHDRVLKLAPTQHLELLRVEHDALNAVQHPNLERCFNLEPWDDHHFLVVEYVEGATLTTWQGAGDRLDAGRFLRIADGLFGALGALHRGGWLHRDVKPDNVMLTFEGDRTVLVDLGLAVSLPAEGASLAAGTVRYKDPLLYRESAWTPANDQYAAFLTLYELLTGVHPFGAASPDDALTPTIEADLLPDDIGRDAAERLATVFRAALSPHRDARPGDVFAAQAALHAAVAPPAVPSVVPPVVLETSRPPAPVEPIVVAPPGALPESATLNDSPDALPDLSARARGALSRLGITRLGQLASAPDTAFAGLRNVGRKTLTELATWRARLTERFGPPAAPAPAESLAPEAALYPPLVGSLMPLASSELAPVVVDALTRLGLRTLGDLAALPISAALALPGLDPGLPTLESLRVALARRAGRAEIDRPLLGLAEDIRVAAGAYAETLVRRVGLGTDAIQATDTPQAHVDLAPLRHPESPARSVVALAESLLGPVGIATLPQYVQSLAVRFPDHGVARGVITLPGLARLTALLLDAEAGVDEADALSRVSLPFWTRADADAACRALSAAATWPPAPRAELEPRVWAALSAPLRDALVRRGVGPGALLDAITALVPDIRCIDADAWYTPPVTLVQALSRHRSRAVPAAAAALVAEATAGLDGLEFESDAPASLEAALLAAGFVRSGERFLDPERHTPPESPTVVSLDAGVARQRWSRRAPIVDDLLAFAGGGGFRAIALQPGDAHRLGPELRQVLAEALGPDNVTLVDVDRTLIAALRATPLWPLVPRFEQAPAPNWRVLHAEACAALDATLADARPGRVTLLTNPSLLGTLGLESWVNGVYDRARGGRHGLVVLMLPGGVHDGRLRLNETYVLGDAKVMGAVFLEGWG